MAKVVGEQTMRRSALPARRDWTPLLLIAAVGLAACGGGDVGSEADGADSFDAATAEPDVWLDVGPDAGPDAETEAGPDAGPDAHAEPDAGPDADAVPDVATPERYVTYRAVGGASMGANALTLVSHAPDRFDLAGSLGGYVEFRYFFLVMERFFFGGFCPMEQLLANLDHIGDADAALFNCPNAPTMPYEWPWDFNHWHYDDNGGDWGRSFYYEVIEGLFMALGNLLYYNPDHPFLPPGVPETWLTDVPESQRCDNPVVVGAPHNFNAEFNPEGAYPLITFCDSRPVVGCYEGDPAQCGEDHPDYFALKGAYDPTSPDEIPVHVALAVDYNGNGVRDYGEPVIINARERFDDTGTDGCFDAEEDGLGGCGGGPGGEDPNGDNFDLLENFEGTETNYLHDDGEPFDDYGLDGVAQAVSGAADHGEGNGVYDYNPRVQATFDWSALAWFESAPVETLSRLQFIFDGGIRDAIHALTGAHYFTNALEARGLPVTVHDGFAGTAGAMFPEVSPDGLLEELAELDFSADAIGHNLLVRYGTPDATPQQIALGDGKHVGTNSQVLNRMVTFFMTAVSRFPRPDFEPAGDQGFLEHSSYYSEAVSNRIRYSISLPPGYDDNGNEDVRYPVVVFLPGHGIACQSMSAAGLLFNMMMSGGELAKFMFLCPEGQCCYRDQVTGTRECACLSGADGMMNCIDPSCQGAHETCDVRKIPKAQLEQECNGGHFFVNYECDRWGDTGAAEVMRYEDAFIELMDHLDANYRTRAPEWVTESAD